MPPGGGGGGPPPPGVGGGGPAGFARSALGVGMAQNSVEFGSEATSRSSAPDIDSMTSIPVSSGRRSPTFLTLGPRSETPPRPTGLNSSAFGPELGAEVDLPEALSIVFFACESIAIDARSLSSIDCRFRVPEDMAGPKLEKSSTVGEVLMVWIEPKKKSQNSFK